MMLLKNYPTIWVSPSHRILTQYWDRMFIQATVRDQDYVKSSADLTVANLSSLPIFTPSEYFLPRPMPSIIDSIELVDNGILKFKFADSSVWSVDWDGVFELSDKDVLEHLYGNKPTAVFATDETFDELYDKFKVIVQLENGNQHYIGEVSQTNDDPYYPGLGTTCYWEKYPPELQKTVEEGSKEEYHIVHLDALTPPVIDVFVGRYKRDHDWILTQLDLIFDHPEDSKLINNTFCLSIDENHFILPPNTTEAIVGRRIKQIYETWNRADMNWKYCSDYQHFFLMDDYHTFTTDLHIVLENDETITIKRKHDSRETSYWIDSIWTFTNVTRNEIAQPTSENQNLPSSARITFITGLPCSGKTTYAIKTFAKNDQYAIFDDVLFHNESLPSTLTAIKTQLLEGKHVILIDPRFCERSRFESFHHALCHGCLGMDPVSIPIDTIVVKSSSEACIANWENDPLLKANKNKLDVNINTMSKQLEHSLKSNAYPNMVTVQGYNNMD